MAYERLEIDDGLQATGYDAISLLRFASGKDVLDYLSKNERSEFCDSLDIIGGALNLLDEALAAVDHEITSRDDRDEIAAGLHLLSGFRYAFNEIQDEVDARWLKDNPRVRLAASNPGTRPSSSGSRPRLSIVR
jgi:hypothetical protein